VVAQRYDAMDHLVIVSHKPSADKDIVNKLTLSLFNAGTWSAVKNDAGQQRKDDEGVTPRSRRRGLKGLFIKVA